MILIKLDIQRPSQPYGWWKYEPADSAWFHNFCRSIDTQRASQCMSYVAQQEYATSGCL